MNNHSGANGGGETMLPINLKVNVKPVFAQLVHSGPYEGPCRVGRAEELTPEAERQSGRAGFERFVAALKDNLGPDVHLLEPAYMEWQDDFIVPQGEFAKLEPDMHLADLVLMGPSGLNQYPSTAIAHRYSKPVGQLGWVGGVDVAAYLRSRGLEGYAFFDYDDLRRVLSLLRVRKAFRDTRVLVAAEGNNLVPTGVVSSIWNMEDLKARYGVNHVSISAQDIIHEMAHLDQAELDEANQVALRLAANAQAVHVSQEDLLRSVNFYVAARRALARHECNAFVIPCFELCAIQTLAEQRVTFCLAHSLLKDEGIPSACEADTNVLMAITLLMYLSRKSAFMGNSYPVDREQNILAVQHDVPGLKMKGLDEPDLPYEIRNFTVGGWGATIRYDFARDVGTPVTLARFDPTGTEVLVLRGELVGGAGFDRVGCSLVAHIRVKDIVDLFRKELDFGHHLAVVYGDYVDDVKELSRLMGYECTEA
jgi:hypothetical protein